MHYVEILPVITACGDSIEPDMLCQALFVKIPSARIRGPQKKLLTAIIQELMYYLFDCQWKQTP